MHDPKTVSFDLKNFLIKKNKHGYRPTLITIWHNDPEKDGTDDSCGWFKRARHGNKKVLAEIEKAFDFDWDADYGSWFDKKGKPILSPSGIALGMFYLASYKYFNGNRDAAHRFMRKRLYDILFFAENTTDSLHPEIVGKYGISKRKDRIEHFASVIYGCVLRWEQPWYRHAKWHIWHWSLQIHPWQAFHRWAFVRCSICKGRFKWKESVYGSWGGGSIWHVGCDPTMKPRHA